MWSISYLVRVGDLEAIQRLVAQGISPDAVDAAFGVTGLIVACEEKNFDAAKLLLSLGASVDKPCGAVATCPIFAAARSGCLELVELLLGAGASVHQRDGLGRSALNAAALVGAFRVVELLLRSGAKDPSGSAYSDALRFSDKVGIAYADVLITLRFLAEAGVVPSKEAFKLASAHQYTEAEAILRETYVSTLLKDCLRL